MASEITTDNRQEFVTSRMGSGWSVGAIKAALRKQFGPQSNKDLERFLSEATAALAVATESDPELTRALDLYRRWRSIADLVNGQLIARDRLHRALKIPPPDEMLQLPRFWGTNSPPPLEALSEIEVLLADLKSVLSPNGDGDGR